MGEVVGFAPGDTLVAFDAPNDAFFYVLDGEAAAYDEVTGARYGEPRPAPVHRRDELSVRRTAQLTNRAVTTVTEIRVPRAAMLQAMADIPEMSDIIITVFAARRLRLIESAQAGLTLIGAETDRAVCRIEAFAVQNRIPFCAHALGSLEALRFADRCGIAADRANVVLGESTFLFDPTPRMLAR